jgi:hypothetical protein
MKLNSLQIIIATESEKFRRVKKETGVGDAFRKPKKVIVRT